MALPKCPLQSCTIGRNPKSADRTTNLWKEQADSAGIEFQPPIYRCTYCDAVWRETNGAVEFLGWFSLGTDGFKPVQDASKIELVKGKRHATA